MPLTPAKTLLLLVFCALMGLVGAFVLNNVYDSWLAHQYWVKPRSSPRRLITYAASPSEFIARLLFIGGLGVAFLSFAAAGLLGMIERALVLRKNFFVGSFRSVVALPLAYVSLAGFCLWFALLFYLPFKYG